MKIDRQCELCGLVHFKEVKTEHFYNDNIVTVVRCLTDSMPMVVLNHHGEATEWELGYMEGVANALFTFSGIRKEPRKILNHVHWHLLSATFVGCKRIDDLVGGQ